LEAAPLRCSFPIRVTGTFDVKIQRVRGRIDDNRPVVGTRAEERGTYFRVCARFLVGAGKKRSRAVEYEQRISARAVDMQHSFGFAAVVRPARSVRMQDVCESQ